MGFFVSKAGEATIGAAGSLGVSFVNNLFAQKAATKQYQRQVDFWQMQNDYNHPLQQRHRLAQAGLNPAAAAGDIAQGNTAGAASSVPGNEYAQQGVIDPNSFVDSLKALAEIENISANSSLLTQKVATEYVETILKQLGVKGQELDNAMKSMRLSQYKDELDAQMEEIRSRGFYQYAMGNSIRQKLPYEVDSLVASAASHRAEAGLTTSQQATEDALRDERERKLQLEGDLLIAQRLTEDALRDVEVSYKKSLTQLNEASADNKIADTANLILKGKQLENDLLLEQFTIRASKFYNFDISILPAELKAFLMRDYAALITYATDTDENRKKAYEQAMNNAKVLLKNYVDRSLWHPTSESDSINTSVLWGLVNIGQSSSWSD